MGAFLMQSIADFDRERNLRQEKSQPAVVIEEGSDFRLQLALSSLQYNQQFINFLDGKANSLLLVNSLFMTMGLNGESYRWLGLLFSLVTIILCLAVLWTRRSERAPRERAQLFYFRHVLRRCGREDLVHDFRSVGEKEALDAVVRQIYDLAHLAERKYSAYRLAQTATGLFLPLWLVLKLTSFLN